MTAPIPMAERFDVRDTGILPRFQWFGLNLPEKERLSCAMEDSEWIVNLSTDCAGDGRSWSAPWSMRLLLCVLFHLHESDRDGKWRGLAFSVRELAEWIYPCGRAMRAGDIERLRSALEEVSKIRVRVPGRRDLQCVASGDIVKGMVRFDVRVPPECASGPKVDLAVFRRLGAESFTRFRAYLSACVIMDRSANEGGAIPRQIPAPVMGDDGKPKRVRGRLKRDAGRMVDHPMAKMAPKLTAGDLAELAGQPRDKRYGVMRGRKAFEALDSIGILELWPADGGFRLFARNFNRSETQSHDEAGTDARVKAGGQAS